MEGVEQWSVDSAPLTSHQPLPCNLEPIQEDHSTITKPELVNRPAILPSPYLRRSRMILPKLIQMPMQGGATRYFGNALDGGEVDVIEAKVDTTCYHNYQRKPTYHQSHVAGVQGCHGG